MGDDNKGKAILSPNDRGKQAASSSSSTCPDPGEHIARILEHLEGLPNIQSQRTPLLSEEVCSSFVPLLMNTLAHRVFDGHFDMQSFRHEISLWLHSKIKGLEGRHGAAKMWNASLDSARGIISSMENSLLKAENSSKNAKYLTLGMMATNFFFGVGRIFLVGDEEAQTLSMKNQYTKLEEFVTLYLADGGSIESVYKLCTLVKNMGTPLKKFVASSSAGESSSEEPDGQPPTAE